MPAVVLWVGLWLSAQPFMFLGNGVVYMSPSMEVVSSAGKESTGDVSWDEVSMVVWQVTPSG